MRVYLLIKPITGLGVGKIAKENAERQKRNYDKNRKKKMSQKKRKKNDVKVRMMTKKERKNDMSKGRA